jgi:uncharacterized membrane protein SpoIIM required for sporulation
MFNEEAYLHKRIESWQRLERLLSSGGSGLARLEGDEMVEAVRLYRQASGDLAYLSTHSSNSDVVGYLNNLVGRAYTEIYRAPRRDFVDVVRTGVATAAQTVRRRRGELLFCLSVFLVGMFFAWGLMTVAPETRQFFVPAAAEENFKHWTEGPHEGRTGGESILATSFYAGNNPRVGIMTIGLSLATFGGMAVMILFENGVLVGALAADCSKTGAVFFLFSSILPHGVSEIGGMIVTSAAGVLMGRTVIAPGKRSRGDALRAVGKDAATLAILGLIMIALAAPIEGFFSFSPFIPQWFKLIVGLLALTAWLSYFIGYAKTDEA